MTDRLAEVLASEPLVAFALVFGSTARGRAHAGSDFDIAVGLVAGAQPGLLALGALTGRLEAATGREIDLVLLDEAPPGLAYRVFRDGRPVFVRDQQALNTRRAAAVLEYLDFKPIEDIFTRGVMAAARRGPGHGR